jgi:hypothetical protein
MIERSTPHAVPYLVLMAGVLSLFLGAVVIGARPVPRSLPPEHPLFGR